jgi:TonB family protein
MTTSTGGAPASTRPSVMSAYKPDWLEKPTADMMEDVYPPAAAMRNIDGKATIQCEVGPEGLLRACKVLSESPPKEGFGQAALTLSKQFRMIPPEGPLTTTPTVTIPVHFSVPESEPFTPPPARDVAIWGFGAAAAALVFLIVLLMLLKPRQRKAAAPEAAP